MKDKIEILEYKKDKDYTDFEIALNHVINLKIKDITVIGGEYGDIDHLFGALLAITKLHTDQNILWLHSEQKILFPKSESIGIGIKTKFSVLPFTDLKNLNISGAKWNLENENIEFGRTKTLRNVARNEKININTIAPGPMPTKMAKRIIIKGRKYLKTDYKNLIKVFKEKDLIFSVLSYVIGKVIISP